MWPDCVRQLARWCLPYGVVEAMRKHREQTAQQLNRIRFYSQFISAGDTVIDVGAHIGNRVEAFRALGALVVAVEPLPERVNGLRRKFGKDQKVEVIDAALGRSLGSAKLWVCSSCDALSTISETFIRDTRTSGRFSHRRWNSQQPVNITTLDALIKQYGEPSFIKIDVEGYELEVLSGLTYAVPALSVEWTPERTKDATQCIQRLFSLGFTEFNISFGESMTMSSRTWRSVAEIKALLNALQKEDILFGDIYARRGRAVEGAN